MLRLALLLFVLISISSPTLYAQGKLGPVDDLKLSPYDLDRVVEGNGGPGLPFAGSGRQGPPTLSVPGQERGSGNVSRLVVRRLHRAARYAAGPAG